MKKIKSFKKLNKKDPQKKKISNICSVCGDRLVSNGKDYVCNNCYQSMHVIYNKLDKLNF